ncbi:MAG: hypothetical protein ACRC5H_01910 [Treponemataceae bacterium]
MKKKLLAISLFTVILLVSCAQKTIYQVVIVSAKEGVSVTPSIAYEGEKIYTYLHDNPVILHVEKADGTVITQKTELLDGKVMHYFIMPDSNVFVSYRLVSIKKTQGDEK